MPMNGGQLRAVPGSRYASIVVIAVLIAAVPILSGCIDEGVEEDDPYTEFSLLGSGQTAENYPESFIVDEAQSVFLVINNQENERVDYTVRISISSTAWSRSYGDLSDIVVSDHYSPEMKLQLRDGEERSIPCRFSVPDVGIFNMQFQLLMDGEEYRTLKLWIKVFDEDMMKISPDGLRIYTAGSSGDPGTMPGTTDPDGYFNFTMGIDSDDYINVDLNFTFRIGEVSKWLRVSWTSDGPIRAVFESGTGYYLPTSFTNSMYSVIPLSFVLSGEYTGMIVEVRSSDWTVEFTIPIS